MKHRKLKAAQWLFLLALIVGTVLIIRQHRDMPYRQLEGPIFGTYYHITYQGEEDFQNEINEALKQVDQSLSPFNPTSIITKINNNEPVAVDQMFADVYGIARKVSEDTDGAFDITVAPLVNLWGFGFKQGTPPSDKSVDSLRQVVGYQKVKLTGNKVEKSDPRVMLDCSAVAKGYGSDVVATLLERHGVTNYMVEIGGEIVVMGVNEKQQPWRIGVNRPTDDPTQSSTELETVLSLTDVAMATSGNYRNFYYKDGKKYAHTIDPSTGRPVQHSLLSATVLAPRCATADAYATSFMVMGLEKAKEVLERHSELKAYLIYSDGSDKYQVWYSPSLRDHIIDN